MLRRGVIPVLAGAIAVAAPAPAAAEPVSGPHQTIDHQYTTTEPGTPTGFHFTGTYHAANDPSGDPPYMRRMTFYPPAGFRYDTTVPARCTASDLELQLRGAAACPERSKLASGTTRGKFMGSETTLDVAQFNNKGGTVMLISTPLVVTVSRGRFASDGSVTYESPTCYPALVTCPADTALQMGSDVSGPAYVRNGRAYAMTPPSCPESGHWESPVRFSWADGSGETVVTRQPCTAPPG